MHSVLGSTTEDYFSRTAMNILPTDRMPEAEVSLRLALYLIRNGYTKDNVDVAIDGAQVRTRTTTHFPIEDFIASEGLDRTSKPEESWRGVYKPSGDTNLSSVRIHSGSGTGDVRAQLCNGSSLLVESKKGKLEATKSSPEYKLIREAIGQVTTVATVNPGDLLGVAIPHSKKSVELCNRWSAAPLIKRSGIIFILVHRNGNVDGLPTIS